MDFIHDDGDLIDKMVTFRFCQVTRPRDNVIKKKKKKIICTGVRVGGPAPHRVLSLQLELVDGQSFGVLQLLDLLHLLVVESDLLVDDHLHTPTEGPRVVIATLF